MGKHRHKKSFYDVDEDELRSTDEREDRHHHRPRRHRSPEKSKERKHRSSKNSTYYIPKIDDDEAALQSPPIKRLRSSPHRSSSPSKILSELIENPEFLANTGPKGKEFAETARQLLSKPNLDPTTQQIICAMAQAAVNVGKRLNAAATSSTEQCIDDLSVTNSTTYSTTTLLSPTLSNTSSSSTSAAPQKQSRLSDQHEDSQTSIELENSEDILIKQMIERAMKLTQQGDTQQAQHLLSIIHEKVSKKRKRGANVSPIKSKSDSSPVAFSSNGEQTVSASPYNLPASTSLDGNQTHQVRSPSNDHECLTESQQPISDDSYPPPPPLPPLPPPPPSSDEPTAVPIVSVPPIAQVQELLSNPSELQDILKKLFRKTENHRVSPPEEYQASYQTPIHYAYHPASIYTSPPMHPVESPSIVHSTIATSPESLSTSQPYNSSLAFLQSHRRNPTIIQANERGFSSSNMKTSRFSQSSSSTALRSYSLTANSSLNNNSIRPLITNVLPNAPPLMTVNPAFPVSTVRTMEPLPTRWSAQPEQSFINSQVASETNLPIGHDQQRNYHPFWCATCALGFPHQVAYQDHLRGHVPCVVPGCSYAASESLVRMHHQTIHENNLRNRINSHGTRPIIYSPPNSETPWPLMRM